MVCEKVAKMTQMRHDILENTLRVVISACSCQSAAQARDRAWPARRAWLIASAGAVDVVVANASAKSYAAQAAKTVGWTAARAEQTTRTRFGKDVPDHAAFQLVPFAVETCGYMGKEAVKFVNRLADIADESGRIPKDSFVRWQCRCCR